LPEKSSTTESGSAPDGVVSMVSVLLDGSTELAMNFSLGGFAASVIAMPS
jgi:hypothetical protein